MERNVRQKNLLALSQVHPRTKNSKYSKKTVRSGVLIITTAHTHQFFLLHALHQNDEEMLGLRPAVCKRLLNGD